jgi:hypothetical protein
MQVLVSLTGRHRMAARFQAAHATGPGGCRGGVQGQAGRARLALQHVAQRADGQQRAVHAPHLLQRGARAGRLAPRQRPLSDGA